MVGWQEVLTQPRSGPSVNVITLGGRVNLTVKLLRRSENSALQQCSKPYHTDLSVLLVHLLPVLYFPNLKLFYDPLTCPDLKNLVLPQCVV